MMKKLIYILVCIISVNSNINAQDQAFTQFFNAPMYLNPGFTGSILEFRAGLNTRLQWPSLDNPFITNAFSLDYNIRGLNSGVGLYVSNDQLGVLNATNFNFLYSYKVNISQKWVVAPGLQYGYALRNSNLSNYVFGSEIVNGQVDSDVENAGTEQVGYFDFGAGVVAFNRQFWFGISVAHLNQPNVSILGDADRLEPTWSIHGGSQIKVNRSIKEKPIEPYFNPSFIYRKQGEFDQLDLGFQFYLDPVMFGAWYRGLALLQDNSIQANSSIALLAGLTFDQFEVGYSYDFIASGIGTRSGGAHEIALIYQFKLINRQKQLKKRQQRQFNSVPPFLREKWWDIN